MRFSSVDHDDLKDVRFTAEIQKVEYDHADLDSNGVLKVPLEAGDLVLSVGHVVNEGFLDSAAETPGPSVLTIGDSSADNAYIAAGSVAEETLNDTYFSSRTAAKYYPSADYIKIKHTISAAPLVSGKGALYIEKVRLDPSWRESMPD